jgi:hypothetical protein
VKTADADLGNPVQQRVHAIRRAFVIPLGLDAFLLLALLGISLAQGRDAREIGVFSFFFLPTAYLFLEGLIRRVSIGEEGLRVRTLWKRKSVQWGEITHVGCLSLPRKVYLLLTTTRGIIIISNAYEAFPLLAAEIVERVGPERVEEEVRPQCGRSRLGIGNVLLAWVAAAFMTGIIVMKVFPFAP